MAAEAETKLINVEQVLDKLLNWSIEAGKNILAALIIFIVGRFVIKQLNRLFRKILERRKLEVSVQTFLESLVSLLLNLVLAFAVISKLGVETTSLAALLASAGVAVGMALSGYGIVGQSFEFCRRADYLGVQALQGRRLHRRAG